MFLGIVVLRHEPKFDVHFDIECGSGVANYTHGGIEVRTPIKANYLDL